MPAVKYTVVRDGQEHGVRYAEFVIENERYCLALDDHQIEARKQGKYFCFLDWSESRAALAAGLYLRFLADIKRLADYTGNDSFGLFVGVEEDRCMPIHEAALRMMRNLEELHYLQRYKLVPEGAVPDGGPNEVKAGISVALLDPAYKKDTLLAEKIRCLFAGLQSTDKDGNSLQENPLVDAEGNLDLSQKFYFLQDKENRMYISRNGGALGGHKKLKIYGRLDCPSAARFIAQGKYIKHRVFFKDEVTAIAAGYRPCGKCMPEAYAKWKEAQIQENTV